MKSQSSTYWTHQQHWTPMAMAFFLKHFLDSPSKVLLCPTQSLLPSLLLRLFFLQPLNVGEPQALVFHLLSVHPHYLGDLTLGHGQIQIKMPMTPQRLSTAQTSSLNVLTCLFQLSTWIHLRHFRLSTSRSELTFPPNRL